MCPTGRGAARGTCGGEGRGGGVRLQVPALQCPDPRGGPSLQNILPVIVAHRRTGWNSRSTAKLNLQTYTYLQPFYIILYCDLKFYLFLLRGIEVNYRILCIK